MPERLQKILAEGGFGSRRECEQLILEGRVEVDREIVTKLGTRVDPETQAIRVDGQKLKAVYKRYFAVNKPRGVISTNKDPSGRLRVVDLIPTDQRVYTVGRLDKDSEGLIIVTNDGDLANKLTHPRFGVEKTYLIQVAGHPTREQMESLVAGVHLADGFVQIKHFTFKRKQKHTTEIEIVLDEGRNREVRRLLAKIGHKVLFLRRVAVGSFVMEGIPFGASRQLTQDEVELLSINPKRRASKTTGKKSKNASTKRKTAETQTQSREGARTKKTGTGFSKPKTGSPKKKTTRKKSATRGSSSPAGRKKVSRKSAPKRKTKARSGSGSSSRSTTSAARTTKKKTGGKSKNQSSGGSRRGQGRNQPSTSKKSQPRSRRR